MDLTKRNCIQVNLANSLKEVSKQYFIKYVLLLLLCFI